MLFLFCIFVYLLYVFHVYLAYVYMLVMHGYFYILHLFIIIVLYWTELQFPGNYKSFTKQFVDYFPFSFVGINIERVHTKQFCFKTCRFPFKALFRFACIIDLVISTNKECQTIQVQVLSYNDIDIEYLQSAFSIADSIDRFLSTSCLSCGMLKSFRISRFSKVGFLSYSVRLWESSSFWKK